MTTPRRGSATSAITFLRGVGMTLGITLFGIVQRNLFAREMGQLTEGAGVVGVEPRELMRSETRSGIPEETLQLIVDKLSSSITTTFLWTLFPAVLTFLAVWFMSKERLKDAVADTGQLDSREVAG